MMSTPPPPPPNPYQGKGSLEVAWRKGFEGKRRLAHPRSSYGIAYRLGKEARADWEKACA